MSAKKIEAMLPTDEELTEQGMYDDFLMSERETEK